MLKTKRSRNAIVLGTSVVVSLILAFGLLLRVNANQRAALDQERVVSEALAVKYRLLLSASQPHGHPISDDDLKSAMLADAIPALLALFKADMEGTRISTDRVNVLVNGKPLGDEDTLARIRLDLPGAYSREDETEGTEVLIRCRLRDDGTVEVGAKSFDGRNVLLMAYELELRDGRWLVKDRTCVAVS